jgi:DNA-3-methyladenine glycosylase I
MSYCTFCMTRPENDVHRVYHDTQYGFSLNTDDEFFGRLILEINQAGLSWETILKKQDNFYTAFDQFSIKRIANYEQEKIDELLNNSGIIRNKLKINSVIYNAQRVCEIQREYGSFQNWLNHNKTKNLTEWVLLFKKTFKFVGVEIVKEFLMSTNYLPGAHDEDCPVLKKIVNY